MNDNMLNNDDVVYTVKEVADILHVNKNYVYNLINKNLIPVMKFKSYRIRRSSLIKFLNEYENVDLSQI